MFHRFISSIAVLAFALLIALGSPARAQQSSPVARPKNLQSLDPAAAEILELFLATCLSKFPDDDSIKAYMTAKQYRPMSAEETARYLKSDPGMGWFRPAASGGYVITIEFPPYHACAVRRLYAKVPDFKRPYEIYLSTWMGTLKNNASLHLSPPQTMTLPGRFPVSAYVYDLVRAGAPNEKLMALVTSYPNGVTELRLVRQLPPPSQ